MTIRRRRVYDEDHEALRASVARFLDSGAAERQDLWAAAAEHGFVGLGAPEVDDPRFAAVVLEAAMAAGLPAFALSLAAHDGFALPLLAGRRVATRPAVVDGGDVRLAGGLLRGRAETVVNGMSADLLLVVARTDDGDEHVVLVEAGAVHREPAEPLLGLEGLDVADCAFDLALDGNDAGNGTAEPIDADLERARASHQLALAVAAVAGARTALDITVAYTRDRKAFGTPIATFGNTRHVLGSLGARIAAVESFVDAALESPSELSLVSAAALRLCATEILGTAVDTGVQLHGGYGYMWEYPIARAYAAARFFRVHSAGEHLQEVLAGAVGL